MTYDSIYMVCNGLAIAGWSLLIILPRWKWSQRLISAVLIPLLLGGVYFYLFMLHRGSVEGSFQSLQALQLLMTNPGFLVAGWVHYLCFDLFIGAWEVRDANRLGIQHWHIMPCLLFTGLYGPIGLLLYFFIRFIMTRKIMVGTPGEEIEDEEDNSRLSK